MNSIAWLTAILALLTLPACALLGRRLLDGAGMRGHSLLGSGFVVGYALVGLVLELSLRFLHAAWPGLVVSGLALAAAVAASVLRGRGAPQEPPAAPASGRRYDWVRYAIALVVLSWAAAVVLTFLPTFTLRAGEETLFPDIYDLPKHLFAMLSVQSAQGWPAPNPFLAGAPFAYNVLFYLPLAWLGSVHSLAGFQTFSLALTFTALALPLVLLDLAKQLSASRPAHLASVLLATWVGGLTPLWVTGVPAIGFLLYQEQILSSAVWIDETFESVLFVPQHIFAVLCGLLMTWLIATLPNGSHPRRRLLLAGALLVAASLSSLILLPHLLVAYFLSTGLMTYRLWREGASGRQRSELARWGALILLPLGLLAPFVLEVQGWTGGEERLFAWPELTAQWAYVVAAAGAVVPLAVLGVFARTRPDAEDGRELPARLRLHLLLFCAVGVLGMLFAAYGDAGIKSGLWLRIALVPLAALGVAFLVDRIRGAAWHGGSGRRESGRRVLGLLGGAAALAIVALNLPTARYFVASAWRPLDPSVVTFVQQVRALPASARIVYSASDQTLMALTGRQIDFDFTPVRGDAYLPYHRRDAAQEFWTGLHAQTPEAQRLVRRHYDYLIVPLDSALGRTLSGGAPSCKTLPGHVLCATRGGLSVSDIHPSPGSGLKAPHQE